MAASLKVPKQMRWWNKEDALEKSDVAGLFNQERVKTAKSINCVKYWFIYCTFLGLVSLFIVGVLFGYIGRVDHKVTVYDCSQQTRNDGFGEEKLQAIHNNVVYHMSGAKMLQTFRELFSLSDAELLSLESDLDKTFADFIEKEFRKFKGFDSVDVEVHELVVTYPDPDHPNRLEIMSQDGSTRENVTLMNNRNIDRGDNSRSKQVNAEAAVQGKLVYGHYGRYTDMSYLQRKSLLGSIALLRLGQNSVPDKVKIASEFGCAGALLFCHHDDECNHDNGNYSEAQLLSAAVITDDMNLLRLPVVTVSYDVAMDLVQRTNITSWPEIWRSVLWNQTHTAAASWHNQGYQELLISLQVNTKQISRRVYNVIGTIKGSDEPDRQVLIGASKKRYPESDHEWATSTAMLLDLARSMTHIKDTEGWKPRRTITFVSSGGGYMSQLGLVHYLKSHRHNIEQEVIAYINLDNTVSDLSSTAKNLMKFISSQGLTTLVHKAADMVPDPAKPEFSLAEDWPDNWYLTYESLGYSCYPGEILLIHQMGIPSVTIQLLQGSEQKTSQNNDHIWYHLAAARVVSHIVVRLVDDIILPINVTFSTEYVNQTVSNSLHMLKAVIPQHVVNSDELLDSLKLLVNAGRTFSSIHKDCSKVNQLNNILMRFDSIFMDIHSDERLFESLLSMNGLTGCLTLFSEALDSYLLNKDTDKVQQVIKSTIYAIREAVYAIRTLE